MRTTILMTLDGNLAQIPNATVYKEGENLLPGASGTPASEMSAEETKP
ncbi:hypothetical protein [uncultured Thiodictyon sp.]|nr:hypothetical protein [uncultured Thiodictyon sp.]